MNTTKFTLLASIAICTSLFANWPTSQAQDTPINMAPSEQTGKVKSLRARSRDGLVQLNVTGDRTAPPECASPNYWVLDTASPAFDTQIQLLEIAIASRQEVVIVGTGTCSIWSGAETIEEVVLQRQ